MLDPEHSITSTTPLGIEILTAYSILCTAFESIPEEQRTQKNLAGTVGQISPCDLIAYQIGWGTSLHSWYQAGIQGKQADMPGHGFTTWDYAGLAALFYKKYAYDNGEEQLKAFDSVVEKIIAFVDEESAAGNLEKEGVWRWCTLKSGKQWPLGKWVQVNTVAPYKKATLSLRKL